MGIYGIIQENNEIPFWDILRKVGKIFPQWENFPVFRKTKSHNLGKYGNIVDKISEQVCPFLGNIGKMQENMGLFWENTGLFFPKKIAIFNCAVHEMIYFILLLRILLLISVCTLQ